MKKQTIHFSWRPGINDMAACGADMVVTGFNCRELKITDYRRSVTCKNCRATRRFRKLK